MSYSAALGVVPNRRPVELARFRNASGWAPSIWNRLLVDRGFDGYAFGVDGTRHLHQLWHDIEALPSWQQVPLVLTFDTGIIPWQEYAWAADRLDEFDERLPEQPGYVNHVPAMADLLRSNPEVPFFGVYGTSVTDNPFDPWDEEADADGSGIPFVRDGVPVVYLLERHRPMASEVLARTT